ncbi:hypothetical protein BN903_173 [Halorubrum sp. AJ67]|nr:hypothetical protein BN903_173 [Halorubrum sp. AJ67]
MIRTTDAELAERSVAAIVEEVVESVAPPGADASFAETETTNNGTEPIEESNEGKQDPKPLTDGAEVETDEAESETD